MSLYGRIVPPFSRNVVDNTHARTLIGNHRHRAKRSHRDCGIRLAPTHRTRTIDILFHCVFISTTATKMGQREERKERGKKVRKTKSWGDDKNRDQRRTIVERLWYVQYQVVGNSHCLNHHY